MYPVESFGQYRNVFMILLINKFVIGNKVLPCLANKWCNLNRIVVLDFIILFQDMMYVRLGYADLPSTIYPGFAVYRNEIIGFNGAYPSSPTSLAARPMVFSPGRGRI